MYRVLYPMRTYLIVSGRINEEVNIMTADWVMPVSARPFITAVSVSPRRYTHKLIKRYKEYVISIPTIDMLRDVWIAGSESGPEKIKKLKISFKDPVKTSVPLIKEAVANLECKVIDEHDYGDHTLFIGEVLYVHYDKNVFKEDDIDLRRGFLAHIAYNKFITFREEIFMP
jgi:flavin reductase (DIM6/NTAB) family NADH-FMN oxidoreductase RutF